MEIPVITEDENLVSIARRSSGQYSTRITVIYSKGLEGDPLLLGCEQRTEVLLYEFGTEARREPLSATIFNYFEDVTARLSHVIEEDEMRELTVGQTTEEWYPL